MSLSLALRPRSAAERLGMATVTREAPLRVGVTFDDDGWVCANLWIAGRVPVWLAEGGSARADACLAKLGLPPVARGEAEARLDANLTWLDAPRAAASAPLPGVEGPLVTILVCTFNRAHLIGAALDSAAAQRWPCEVVVVNDGSTDGTRALLDGRPGVRAFHQEPNQGKPAALARGLAEARGDAILVLDDDDLLLPGALHVLATALFGNPSAVAVWADTAIFDDASGNPAEVRPACRLPAAMVPQAVLQQIPAMPGATLVRTAAWRAAGPLDPRLIRGQDMDLFLALSRLGEIQCLPLTTFWYRSHDALRGAAEGQWNKRDTEKHRQRFLSYVSPVFRDRWRQLAPAAGRSESHAWALGLHQRELGAEARKELGRWKGPWSLAEAWVRTECGLKTEGKPVPGVLVVVDDGDEGALEATLHTHALGERLFVSLEVPRDPLGSVRLYWPGTYSAREQLGDWVKQPGPWRVALSSAPEWAPPELADPGLLPPLRGADALLALAAVLDWPEPARSRRGLAAPTGPVASLSIKARAAIRAGKPALAMGALAPLLEKLPGWRGGWHLAAEALAAMGQSADADACRQRAAAPKPQRGRA